MKRDYLIGAVLYLLFAGCVVKQVVVVGAHQAPPCRCERKP